MSESDSLNYHNCPDCPWFGWSDYPTCPVCNADLEGGR
jgi:hypothetical protein